MDKRRVRLVVMGAGGVTSGRKGDDDGLLVRVVCWEDGGRVEELA